MTQKEKLEEAKRLYQTANADQKYVLESLFPELAESEDERIRKTLIELVEDYKESSAYGGFGGLKWDKLIAWLEKQGKETNWKPSKEEMDVLYGLAYITNQYDEHKEDVITRLYQDLKREFFNGSSYENMFPNTEDGVRRRSTIQVLEYARSLDTYNQYGKADIDKNIAWLEKQGEQKPAWNEEDEVGLDDAMWAIEQAGTIAKDENDMGNLWYAENWLKSIKGRVQPKQEWSEKDKCMLNNVIGTLKPLSQTTHSAYAINSMIDWLKSLKQRYTWKPSDEQMKALWEAYKGGEEQAALASLYSDLKKLKR